MRWSFPTEVVGVLRQHPGYSICVKGQPGSCKTSFVLTLLKHLFPDLSPVYVSTRVNAERLWRSFPWTRDCLPASNIIDAAACRAESEAGTFELLKYRTNIGLAQSIYRKISILQNPVICVDSWTQIVRVASGSSKDLFELFCELCLEQGARMVLVVETSSQTELDHLVDGLIDMGTVECREGVYRYLQIRKLTGISHELRKQLVEVNDEGLVVMGPVGARDAMGEKNMPITMHTEGGST